MAHAKHVKIDFSGPDVPGHGIVVSLVFKKALLGADNSRHSEPPAFAEFILSAAEGFRMTRV